ncbi:pentapeptide repeat-containing protein [Actinomadura soli]|uniref:Pentapeptide repeat-containing protein n=1 Tax=Actinomadura soli TaxID=2508997 RepID=A0A5C4JES0_9ACTN|nr:pentapeptide repeat-containing protein [Actinomadura soli]TMR03380.1 pentapeptide repeat-containing protein [Actinomadura soli]
MSRPADLPREHDVRTAMQQLQVRRTAQRLLHTHLQPAADVHWSGISLDLTGTTFIEVTLTGCHLHTADFTGAIFSSIAEFSGTTFSEGAWFRNAAFSEDARFDKASFSGNAGFSGATFAGVAGLGRASFSRGVDLEAVTVADVSLAHQIPAGWEIQPASGAEGRFVPAGASSPSRS